MKTIYYSFDLNDGFDKCPIRITYGTNLTYNEMKLFLLLWNEHRLSKK